MLDTGKHFFTLKLVTVNNKTIRLNLGGYHPPRLSSTEVENRASV